MKVISQTGVGFVRVGNGEGPDEIRSYEMVSVPFQVGFKKYRPLGIINDLSTSSADSSGSAPSMDLVISAMLMAS